MPGPNEPSGFILTTILGIVGAFVASYLGQALGWYGPGEGAGLIGAVVGAILVGCLGHGCQEQSAVSFSLRTATINWALSLSGGSAQITDKAVTHARRGYKAHDHQTPD
jgi:uncharacterized membrane protein YeaQ/YmgE (transglycosylase-associated protein family)